MLTLNILLKTVIALSFVIKFDVEDGDYQDYFSFNSNKTTAHLSRADDTLNLILTSGSNYEIHQMFNISEGFEFQWKDFRVNGRKMIPLDTEGHVGEMLFDAYTFFSPHVEIHERDVDDVEVGGPVYSCEEINYGLISFIFFVVGTFLVSGGTICDCNDGLLINSIPSFKHYMSRSNENSMFLFE